MTTDEQSREEELFSLHGELVDLFTGVVTDLGPHTVSRAIRIGELLTEVKKQQPPEEWRFWLMRNVPFIVKRRARNYIAAFKNSIQLESAVCADMALKWQVDALRRFQLAGHDAALTSGLETPKPKQMTNAEAKTFFLRRAEKIDELEKQIEAGIEATFRNLRTLNEHRQVAPHESNYIHLEEKFGTKAWPVVLLDLADNGATPEEMSWHLFSLVLSVVSIEGIDAFIWGDDVHYTPKEVEAEPVCSPM